jgi:hypothetical protein
VTLLAILKPLSELYAQRVLRVQHIEEMWNSARLRSSLFSRQLSNLPFVKLGLSATSE